MKFTCIYILAGLACIFLIAAGCTTQAPAAPTATATPTSTPPAAPPGITGVWTGTSTGYLKSTGFIENAPFRLNITVQKGQAFTGVKEYVCPDGKVSTENVSGIVTPSGEVYLADDVKGVNLGRLTDPDTLEVFYLEDGPGEAKAMISHLRRQKG
jgi:hypothetical protein